MNGERIRKEKKRNRMNGERIGKEKEKRNRMNGERKKGNRKETV